jgi:hypothetical protein
MRRNGQRPSTAEAFADLSYEELVDEAELALDRGDVDTALALSEAAERREVEHFQAKAGAEL